MRSSHFNFPSLKSLRMSSVFPRRIMRTISWNDECDHTPCSQGSHSIHLYFCGKSFQNGSKLFLRWNYKIKRSFRETTTNYDFLCNFNNREWFINNWPTRKLHRKSNLIFLTFCVAHRKMKFFPVKFPDL